MQTIKLILKGIFLYMSIIFWVIFIGGADSILDQNLIWLFIAIAIVDIVIFKLFYNMNDLKVLSFEITLKQYKENETRK